MHTNSYNYSLFDPFETTSNCASRKRQAFNLKFKTKKNHSDPNQSFDFSSPPKELSRTIPTSLS